MFYRGKKNCKKELFDKVINIFYIDVVYYFVYNLFFVDILYGYIFEEYMIFLVDDLFVLRCIIGFF